MRNISLLGCTGGLRVSEAVQCPNAFTDRFQHPPTVLERTAGGQSRNSGPGLVLTLVLGLLWTRRGTRTGVLCSTRQ